MKPTNLFALLLILTTALLPVSCAHLPEKPTRFWDTGNATVDSLLTLFDYYDLRLTLGEDKRDALDSTILTVGTMKQEAPAAAMLAEIWHKEYCGRESFDAERWRLDSIVLAKTDTSKSPYLAARIKMDMAKHMTHDQENQVKILFDLLPYFTGIRDSLFTAYTLIAIGIEYSKIYDYSTFIECMQEVKRIIPDSLPEVRAIMDFNIAQTLRARQNTEQYMAIIDSISKSNVRLIPEIGLQIYTDLYELKGDPAYMDTAATYYTRITDENQIHRLYYRIHQLRLFDQRGLTDSAQIRCAELTAIIKDGNPYNAEIISALIRHYRHMGNNAAIIPLRKQAHVDSLSRVASTKATKMSHNKASQEMTRLREILHPTEKDIDNNKWLWLTIGIVGVIVIGIVLNTLHRRKKRRQPAQLEETPTDNADRKLVAATLVSASNETEDKAAVLGGFDVAFSRVRPGFTDELLALHPKLTAYELRLCSLLSIGLDTKEIARILSINPDSVKKSRQRLRAKLGIPSDMTFIEYFRNLPQ
ncbi:MAG: LuxR C-terminal-related transcriptional regulator [Muribaculaceae bacterium]